MKSPLWENIFQSWSRKESKKVMTLKQVPIFSDLTEREYRELEKIIHERHYAPDEVIFKIGAPGVGMYVILEGVVDIVLEERGDRTKTCILATLRSGDFFGELALLDEQPRSAKAIAKESTTLLGFFRPDFLGLLERKPRMGIKILFNLSRVLSERLRKTNQALQEALERNDQE